VARERDTCFCAQSASPDCDLLIKGGTVIDLDKSAAALDVAVKNGKILEVSPNIPLPARSVVSAKAKS